MGSGLAFCLNVCHHPDMARPLRIEFPGAVYHVTSRGDRGEPIFDDDEDRMNLLSVVRSVGSGLDSCQSFPQH